MIILSKLLRISYAQLAPLLGLIVIFLALFTLMQSPIFFIAPINSSIFPSHEQALYVANMYNLDNLETCFGGASYSGPAGTSVVDSISGDFGGELFKPLNNFFAGQSSAAASAVVLKKITIV